MICCLTDFKRYGQMLPLLKALLKKQKVIVICTSSEYELIQKEYTLLAHDNLIYKIIPSQPKVFDIFQNFFIPKNSLLFKLTMQSKHTSLGQLFYELYFRYKFHFSYKYALGVFQEYDISSLVIIMDRFSMNIGFVKRAKELHVPIIQPYYHNPIASYVIRQNNKKYMLNADLSIYQKKIFHKFVSKKYGDHLNNGYFFYPAFLLNAWHKFGLLSKNFWVGGSGASDFVFADTGITQKNLSRHIGSNKVVLTGTDELDTLFKTYSNQQSIKIDICKKYKLDSSKPIVVLSAVPNGEHCVMDMQSAFAEFENLLSCISRSLNYTPLISLHPKMLVNKEKYREIANKFDAVIVEEKLIEMISVGDIYIASAASSTVFWGILCGIKTISLDLWNLQNDLFATSSSKVNATSYDKLERALKLMDMKDISFDNDWEQLKKEEIFDGNALQREVNFITEKVVK